MRGLHRGRAGIGILVLGLVVWSCSSAFREGYEPGGAGEGGEASSTASAGDGGASGSNAGASGAGAESSAGALSEGGGNPPSERLSVVTTTPEDSAIGTERDLAIEVVFSAAIEPNSVTSETFQVHGPTGVIEGKLSVAEAKVTFVPTAPWSLLADYSVDIAEKVSAAQAGELGATYRFGFQTRDGVFRKPERLFSSPAYIATAVGNPTGDVVVGWSDQLTPRSTFAAHFDPKTGKWGAAAPLEADTTNDYSGPSLAMNDAGDVVAISGSYAPISLNRAKGGKWRGAKSAGIEQGGMVSLREDGSAMTVWSAMVQNQYDVFAALLSADDKWGTTTTLATKGGPRALARYGTGYLAVFSHDPGGEVTYRMSDAKGVWGAEQPLAAATRGASYAQLATRDTAALFTWMDRDSRMQVAEFDGKKWVATELGPVTTGTTATVAAKTHIATWLNQASAYAAKYDLATGWGDPVKLGPTTVEDVGPAAGVDDAGNALVVWPNGSDLVWRRFSHSSMDWSDQRLIKDQDPVYVYSSSDASGNVMIIWNNPLGVWASRFE